MTASLYSLLLGPLLVFSLCLFAGGMIWRVHQFFRMTVAAPPMGYTSATGDSPVRSTPLPPSVRERVAARNREEYLRVQSLSDVLRQWRIRLGPTLWGRAPVLASVSVLFHVLVMGIPLVNTAHAILLDTYWSFSPPTLSEPAVERLMMLLLFLMGVLLVRRIVVDRVRVLSTWRDYLALGLTAAPFVTGYLTHHQLWFAHEGLLCLHIASAELLLALIPFTKLAHMPFFLFSRLLIRGEMGLGTGIRQWPDFS